MKAKRTWAAAVASTAAVLSLAAPAAHAAIPPMPQGYPIAGLYQKCSHVEPEWHYGETARRYVSDGVLEFKNTTDQSVDYKAEVKTGTNHKIEATSKAAMPSGWNTTARSDIGLTTDNGWEEGETFGPIKLGPGESFRVEFGVLEKDFIAMFVDCQNGFLQNQPGANVVAGTAPAERYAFAHIIHADGSVDEQALAIPSRAQGANSKPVGKPYNTITGPSLEKIADPKKDQVVNPSTTPWRDASWPTKGEKCRAGYKHWYPDTITGVSPTFRKPGFSQDFLNWSSGEYVFTPITDHVVGAQYNGTNHYQDNYGRLPQGWLGSIGAAQRAYMPVGTHLKPLNLQPGERVRVQYGTTMTRVNYSEFTCGKDGTYSQVLKHPQASAPVGFWAEAQITGKDGKTRTVDVTPDEWAQLPVPTQTDY